MARGTSLNISFTPHHKELIRAKLATGGYHSASEVVREAMRLLEDREQTAFWADVRDKVAVAQRQFDEGKGLPGDQARREMEQYIRSRRPKKSPARGRKG